MKKNPLVLIVFIFGMFFSLAGKVEAATININSCNQSDVQTAVNNASDGDTINIPVGTCTWNVTVSWTDKNINVIGEGKDKTIINISNNLLAFTVNDNNKASFRISGMTLNGTGSDAWGMIFISTKEQNPPKAVYGWRIDDIKFNHGSSSNASISIYGVNWGLIDNCEFTRSFVGGGDSWFLALASTYDIDKTTYSYWGGYSLSLPLDLGTNKAVYIEDNVFTDAGGNASGDTPLDSGYGARYVFRHNIVNGGGILSHPTSNDAIGTLKYEIYNNVFNASSTWPAHNYGYIFHSQGGGTGVFFNNTIAGDWSLAETNNLITLDDKRATGYDGLSLGACDGTHSWDGNIEATGWPCFCQAGRSGANGLVSTPVYAWNNGTQASCATNGNCTDTIHIIGIDNFIKSTPHVNGEVDYVNNGTTPKLGYTPYQYPHPLQNAASTCTTPGDFTCNGFDANDIQVIINIILNIETTQSKIDQAKMNTGDLVDATDLQLLINKVLGIN